MYYDKMQGYNGNDLISIIVPVYNTETYLSACIESILSQTHKNIEVILVDDESKDESGKICDRYAQLDDRVHVIHQKNQGIGGARNAGIDIAQGDWIGFVDSDDWIEPDMYEVLLHTAIENDAEIVDCTYWREWKDYRRIREYKEDIYILEGCEELLRGYKTKFPVVVWSKLYHKSFWKPEIRFKPGKRYEDNDLLFLTCLHCKRLVSINKPLYHYRQRKGSAIHVLDIRGEADYWDARRSGFNELQDKVPKDLWKRLYLDCFMTAYETWGNSARRSKKERMEHRELYNDIVSFFKKHWNEVKASGFSRGITMASFLLRYNNYFAYFAIHVLDLYHKAKKEDHKDKSFEGELFD